DLIECLAILRAIRHGELDRIMTQDAPLDVLTQQLVAESACGDYSEEELFQLARRAWPYRGLARQEFDAVVNMAAEGLPTRRVRRRIFRSGWERLPRAATSCRAASANSAGRSKSGSQATMTRRSARLSNGWPGKRAAPLPPPNRRSPILQTPGARSGLSRRRT